MWRSPRPLLVFWLVWALGSIVNLLVTGVILDMAEVLLRLIFFHYLGSVDLSGWMASPTTVFVFLGGLGLKLISGGGGIGLSLVFIGGLIAGLLIGILFVLFCWQAMAFRAPGIDVPNVEGRLQVNLYLYITCLFHHFFLYI